MTRKADVIFYNGHIVTMEESFPTVESVAVRDGKILAVGNLSETLQLKDEKTVMMDLQNQTMLPGFIDAHSHFVENGLIRKFCVNLCQKPVGNIESIEQMIEALKQRAAVTPKGKPVVGAGYDDTLLKEMRHPMKIDLDEVSTEHPVIVLHATYHVAAANSMAIALAGIEAQTQIDKDYVRRDEAGNLLGLFHEMPGIMPFLKLFINLEEMLGPSILYSNEEYLAAGVTSAQEGAMYPFFYEGIKEAANTGLLKVRLLLLPLGEFPMDAFNEVRSGELLNQNGMLTMGPVKLISDGSLQAYTAYLSNPYYKPHPNMPIKDELYRGKGNYLPEELCNIVEKFHNQGWQIAIHANGDAAIDDVLNAYERAQKKHFREDARHMIIHCQSAREDQLDRIKQLKIMPSFYASHVFYHGDRHRDLFVGPTLAERVHPCYSALVRNIPFSNHNDSPATPMSPLLSIWSAVNRVTSSGKILGAAQSIPVYEAVKSVTINAAYQTFEEWRKGSICKGKYADFVVLDQNPFTVEPMKIRDIKVMKTIVGGQVAYAKA
ncbi:amidohydrolase [Fusibacter ferrireducens]|uniref:Amidohydrolase n=1 Tax=Fusibacter ferrireducens TaxID=2785058 RepID=A0ABR9ZYN9_9FIRM|nr:amidohydrolase [Fusibacter ferrireducens]MBF4695570.1 amidohydrolase [Fusibacter ferrireducens]